MDINCGTCKLAEVRLNSASSFVISAWRCCRVTLACISICVEGGTNMNLCLFLQEAMFTSLRRYHAHKNKECLHIEDSENFCPLQSCRTGNRNTPKKKNNNSGHVVPSDACALLFSFILSNLTFCPHCFMIAL